MGQMLAFLQLILNGLIPSLIAGIFSSGIFLLLLSSCRPKIKISPNIAKGVDPNTGNAVYRIKVVNYSRFPVVDIKAQLHVFRIQQAGGGGIYKSKHVALRRSDPIAIDKYSKKDDNANYAYRFITYQDLDKLWFDDQSQFIRFRLYARHSLSGFGQFVYQDYQLKRNSIKLGEFSKGDTYEIL